MMKGLAYNIEYFKKLKLFINFTSFKDFKVVGLLTGRL